jgi:thioesterase domain-containing protein
MGSLQLSGPCVFKGYYNDPEKTATSFTPDEWFKTGDLALIDSNGKLLLTGREKDSVIINGINYSSQAIEHVIEATQIPGVIPSYVVAFPHRPQGHDTEVLCIVYLPTYDHVDYATRSATEVAISRSVIRYCGVRPYEIIPLEASFLPKSSLGKFSRQNIRDEYEKGNYSAYTITEVKSRQLQNGSHGKAVTFTEQTIIDVSLQLFPNSSVGIGRNSDIFALGFSSIDILQFQSSLQKALNITDIPHTTLFAHPIIHELASALDKLKHTYTFSPVVVLQPHGDKTPIWLIHSGLGEILIFMNFARYITDRPVYALRARGFDGEPHFISFDELITTYHSAIKSTQPEGPYAMAGYAFGGIPAFEIAKRMQARGDEIKFLGLFDQQPFSKDRVRMYDWYRVVLLIASFVGLIEEEYAISYLPEARKLSHDKLLDHIMSLASESRLKELGMSKEKLDNWAQIAFFMKKIMWDYDPEGMVKCMDVFYTVPMKGFGPATNVEDWYNNYISKWDAFVEGGANYHLVGGSHRTMISPPNVDAFQKLFRKVIEERGL